MVVVKVGSCEFFRVLWFCFFRGLGEKERGLCGLVYGSCFFLFSFWVFVVEEMLVVGVVELYELGGIRGVSDFDISDRLCCSFLVLFF